MTDLSAVLAEVRVVPVVEIEDAGTAVDLAIALVAGGLPIMEVTFRTAAAAESIRRISEAVPECHVGAGTLLTPAEVESAVTAGAHFGVSPGWSPGLDAAVTHRGLPMVYGASTASEVQQQLELGNDLVKFFPAEASGGTAVLSALHGPFGPRGVRFMPTGGVKAGNMADYLALPNVIAVGATWVAPRQLIRDRDFDAVAANLSTVRSVLDTL
ncbi:MAG: bifunctional 4-hydroxy-2-oxoglutarate aldolase/2-dehydro-3-deoxy-phosphogluconate aldolase [Propionibacteriaceae bacterium]